MNAIPNYMWLGGDQDGGVTLICDHSSHGINENSIAYHAGWGQNSAHGLPYFGARETHELFAFAREHARTHEGN